MPEHEQEQGRDGGRGRPPMPPREETGPPPGPPVVLSRVLLAGGREVLIRHEDGDYRLRLTSNNRLILTK